MPRKTPVAEHEIAIGSRLREAREAIDLSRPQLAARIGIDSARLVNYELGRVPAPFHVAVKIAAVTGKSIYWFADALTPHDDFRGVPAELVDAIPVGAKLSTVHAKILAKLGAAELRSDSPLQRQKGSPKWWFTLRAALIHPVSEDRLLQVMESARSLPSSLRSEFIDALEKAASSFLKSKAGIIEKAAKAAALAEKERKRELIEAVRSALAEA